MSNSDSKFRVESNSTYFKPTVKDRAAIRADPAGWKIRRGEG